jgi:hypothetical protein
MLIGFDEQHQSKNNGTGTTRVSQKLIPESVTKYLVEKLAASQSIRLKLFSLTSFNTILTAAVKHDIKLARTLTAIPFNSIEAV